MFSMRNKKNYLELSPVTLLSGGLQNIMIVLLVANMLDYIMEKVLTLQIRLLTSDCVGTLVEEAGLIFFPVSPSPCGSALNPFLPGNP